ncbi:MAG: radical SAM protein [Candidatus Omnitrophota bacterium]|nr:radical SAM protein [Candidatus Omnitrophota bacterium]
MKILLLVPPEISAIEPYRSSKKLRDCVKVIKGFPLGLGYIAAVLQQNDFEVSILNAQINDFSMEQMMERIRGFSPQVIGITTYTANIKTAVESARLSKAWNKDVVIVFGGPHATHDHRNLLENYGADFVVFGEGEFIFRDLAMALLKRAPLDNVKGIAYRDGADIKVNPGDLYIKDLDSLPYPARHLTDFNKYLGHFTHDLSCAAQVMTSRGCPYSCAFCSSGSTFSKWRGRRAQSVVEEIEFVLGRYPAVRSISFMDDNFTLDKARVEEICRLLIKKGLNRYHWDCLSRCAGQDAKLLGLMKEAGCARIQYGVESASPAVLENINKAQDLAQVRNAVKLTKNAGIEAYAFFMVGNPGETEGTIRESVRFALELKPTYANWFVTQVYPGTKLAALQGQDDWVKYVYAPEIENPSLYTHPCVPVFTPDGFDREMLKVRVSAIMKKFFWAYLPSNFLKWLKKLIRHPLYSLWYLKRMLLEN